MILLSGIYAAKIHLLYIQTDKSIVVTPAFLTATEYPSMWFYNFLIMLKYRICKLRLDHQNSRFNVLVLYVDCGYVTGYKFVIFYMIKVIIYA